VRRCAAGSAERATGNAGRARPAPRRPGSGLRARLAAAMLVAPRAGAGFVKPNEPAGARGSSRLGLGAAAHAGFGHHRVADDPDSEEAGAPLRTSSDHHAKHSQAWAAGPRRAQRRSDLQRQCPLSESAVCSLAAATAVVQSPELSRCQRHPGPAGRARPHQSLIHACTEGAGARNSRAVYARHTVWTSIFLQGSLKIC
jgi:hypothetical protein